MATVALPPAPSPRASGRAMADGAGAGHHAEGGGRHKVPRVLAGGRFQLEHKLGEGSFGMVYSGVDSRSGAKVAVKLEVLQREAAGQLGNEARLMDILGRPTRPQGFAEVHFFGKEGPFAILVMDLLSKSVQDSVESCGGRLNVRTSALIAQQAIYLLAYVHSKGIVHRDVKTENFMWGLGPKVHHLYLIDFGMSSRFWLKKHVRMTTGNQLTGTARYASVSAMKGCTQSRRDDLEALGHMLMYLLRGSLPWSGLDAKTYTEKLKLICEKKDTLPLRELCGGFPSEFEDFLRYCRHLEFEKRPDYDELVRSFQSLRDKQSPPVEDHHLQWIEGSDIDAKSLAPFTLPARVPAQPDDLFPLPPPAPAPAVVKRVVETE